MSSVNLFILEVKMSNTEVTIKGTKTLSAWVTALLLNVYFYFCSSATSRAQQKFRNAPLRNWVATATASDKENDRRSIDHPNASVSTTAKEHTF